MSVAVCFNSSSPCTRPSYHVGQVTVGSLNADMFGTSIVSQLERCPDFRGFVKIEVFAFQGVHILAVVF